MSKDDPEIPQSDIEEEFARAEQMLADARKATEVGISKATILTSSHR